MRKCRIGSLPRERYSKTREAIRFCLGNNNPYASMQKFCKTLLGSPSLVSHNLTDVSAVVYLQRNNDKKKEARAEDNAFKFAVPRAIKIFLSFFLSTDNQLTQLSSQRYNVFN